MYYYKVYYETTLLRDSRDIDDTYETEEEAREEAELMVEDKIEQWKADEAWHEGDDSEDYFDIVIEEE